VRPAYGHDASRSSRMGVRLLAQLQYMHPALPNRLVMPATRQPSPLQYQTQLSPLGRAVSGSPCGHRSRTRVTLSAGRSTPSTPGSHRRERVAPGSCSSAGGYTHFRLVKQPGCGDMDTVTVREVRGFAGACETAARNHSAACRNRK